MAVSQEYHDYVMDRLTHVYPVRERKMFGGLGIFIEEGMFALVTAADVLHFKVDDSNRADYEAADMPQFARMPYYEVPVEVLESDELLTTWMEKSMEIARAAKK
jgi:DNA transformation protein